MPDNLHSSKLVALAQQLGLDRLARQWTQQYLESGGEQSVYVLVVGEYNHGKSSLINALINLVVLPYGVTPTTKLDTSIRFGAADSFVTVRGGGVVMETWTWEDYQQNHLRLGAFENIPEGADSIEISLRETPFGADCVFVDTPGLNEASMSRENYLARYLNRADILLFVLDASQAMTRAEQNIVRELAKIHADAARILVINKCDRLDDEEWLDVCAHVETAVSPIIGNELFYMVSAKKQAIGDMADLRERLISEISARKQNVLVRAENRACSEMRDMLRLLGVVAGYIQDLPRDIRADIGKKLKSAKGTLKPGDAQLEIVVNMMDLLQIQIRDDAGQFKAAFLQAMPREIDKASIADVEAYFEDFIDASFDDFAQTLKSRCHDEIAGMLAKVWALSEDCGDDPASSRIHWHDMQFPFEIVDHYVMQPGKAGAFGDTQISVFDNHISLLDIGVTGLITGRMARAHREKFKQMAKASIERRTDQTIHVFERDIGKWRESILTTIREIGPRFLDFVADMMLGKADFTNVIADIELETSDACGGVENA